MYFILFHLNYSKEIVWYPRIISDGPPSPLYDFCMVLWKRMLVYADRVWPAIHLIEHKPRLRQEARSRLAKWLSALCHWPRCSKELIAERWQTRSGMVESCQHDLPSLFHSLQGSYNRTQWRPRPSIYCHDKLYPNQGPYFMPRCLAWTNVESLAETWGTQRLWMHEKFPNWSWTRYHQ